MRIIFSILILATTLAVTAQSNKINGVITDETGVPLPSSTVVLLNPADSTMLYFGISGSSGQFEIRGIKKDNYLLQAAFIGSVTYYKNITIPFHDDGNMGTIVLEASPVSMDEVQVTGERIPLRISQDTVVFDAKAFKTSPDANVEELLKKLPGVEVDRAGNIKALGEDVNNVLVDGKEFFSSDPKVATKNLPARALDKVQLYNKKTEESEFTGIDDGARNQTINLILNEEDKDGVFGELMAGGGTGMHYDAKAKVYKFTDKSQIAGLGMANNINKFGFSVGDYISFVGGIANISHGKGGIGSGGFPVNFGQTMTGNSTLGAGGLNYSYSKSKFQRFFISYLASGSKRELEESTKTTNYRSTVDFLQEDYSEQTQRDTSHNLTFGVRYLFRETNNLIINGGASYNTGFIPLSSYTTSSQYNVLINDITRNSSDLSSRLSGNISATYLKKINEGSTLLKVSGNGSYTANNSETEFSNKTKFYSKDMESVLSQFQNNAIISRNLGGNIALTQRLFEAVYMDISLQGSLAEESLVRRQGDIITSDVLIDSLSPEFIKLNQSLRPGLTLKRNTEKMTLSVSANYLIGNYNTSIWGDGPEVQFLRYLQPAFNWQYRYKTGRRMSLRYSSSVNSPTANQLLPVVNNFNSLSLFYGNRSLQPEYKHSAHADWWIFDQFSFTTLFMSVRANYTENKINYDRTINDQLAQEIRLVNVDSDYSINGNIDFTTPIRVLGIKTNIDLAEGYNKGINIVNGAENEVTNINHSASLSIDNRKKDKLDVITGVGISVTDARYSIQESLNNVYSDISWFTEMRYNPTEKLEFFFSADITNYTAQSFDEAQLVPLLGAEISYFFLKNNRATVSLGGHDLLNKNTGISRVSEMNFLRERTSNIIGRYFMLTFKYRLNKFGGNTGMDIKMKHR